MTTALLAEPVASALPAFNMTYMGSEEFLRDPHTPLRLLRERAPVFRNEHGHWLFTRHRDCRMAYTDARMKNLVRRAPALELRGEPAFKRAFAMRGFSTMPVRVR